MHASAPSDHRPHLPLHLANSSGEELIAHFEEAWSLTDWLFSGLVDDDAYQCQPDPLRNPLIFYFGHPAAFYLNKLTMAGLLDAKVDSHLQDLLAVGVDPATRDDLDLSDVWPTAAQVREFRAAAVPRILTAIDGLQEPPAWSTPGWAVVMGIEHERIHFETSSVLFRQLPLDRLRTPRDWTRASTTDGAATGTRVRLPGGPVRLGKPPAPDTFGWDNEFGRLDAEVEAFEAGAHLVSNGEMRAFVEDGGYRDRRWWSGEAWAWLEAGERSLPPFWRTRPSGIHLRTVFEELPLPEAWPAEVTRYEAAAYCAWVGGRLPTEAEWVHMARDAQRIDGDTAFHPAHHLHVSTCSPRGVTAGHPTGEGIHDPVGNVLQWLEDDFRPLPGFRTHPLYRDFSQPYFDDRHQTLRGGSWASTGATASEYYRLWFRPFFLQHAGFRVVWDVT